MARKSAKNGPVRTSVASVCRLALASADGMAFANMRNQEVASMGRAFILWLLGVPASVLVVLWLIGFFH